MSGREQTSQPDESTGESQPSCAAAPPSFGHAAPQDPARDAQAAQDPENTGERDRPAHRMRPLGPRTPWWAAESTTDPASDDSSEDAAFETAGRRIPAGETETADHAAEAADAHSEEHEAGRAAPDDPAPGAASAEDDDTPPRPHPTSGRPPGRLVAGLGVPSIDTRRAVPAEPIGGPPPTDFSDTDPDGIPVQPGPEDAADDDPAGLLTTRPDASFTPADTATGSTARVAGTRAAGTPASGTPATEAGAVVTRASGAGASATSELTADPPSPESALTPDAILPPGVSPTEPVAIATADPAAPPVAVPLDHSAHAGSPGHPDQPGQVAPAGAEPGPTGALAPVPRPAGSPSPGPDPLPVPATGWGDHPGGAGRRDRRRVVTAGVVAGTVLVAAIAVIGLASVFGSGEQAGSARTGGTQARPSPPQDPTPSATPSTKAPPSLANIDNERTDRRPLALTEVFPTANIGLGGRRYKRDRSSVNHQCALAARGGMARALGQVRCRSVVRSTFVDGDKRLAVTAGVAVLPNRSAAMRAQSAGDPAKYEWFRGLPGRRSTGIDQAGGFASSTVRGRYVVYAYATYTNGRPPQPGDKTLTTVARQFIGYTVRPIDRRAG